MKLPKTDQPERYVGLYVIDFGDHCALGYTATEVAALLESEQFADAKAYKIHRAGPDGTLELAGVPRERFSLESGMFFHAFDEPAARRDYQRLLDWSHSAPPPCTAKVHLGKMADGPLLVALIYPAEHEEEMGRWLVPSGFVGAGPVDAGISQVDRYYQQQPQILESQQLWPEEKLQPRTPQQLLACVGMELQR